LKEPSYDSLISVHCYSSGILFGVSSEFWCALKRARDSRPQTSPTLTNLLLPLLWGAWLVVFVFDFHAIFVDKAPLFFSVSLVFPWPKLFNLCRLHSPFFPPLSPYISPPFSPGPGQFISASVFSVTPPPAAGPTFPKRPISCGAPLSSFPPSMLDASLISRPIFMISSAHPPLVQSVPFCTQVSFLTSPLPLSPPFFVPLNVLVLPRLPFPPPLSTPLKVSVFARIVGPDSSFFSFLCLRWFFGHYFRLSSTQRNSFLLFQIPLPEILRLPAFLVRMHGKPLEVHPYFFLLSCLSLLTILCARFSLLLAEADWLPPTYSPSWNS